jgi:hypothetical protein
MRTVLFFFLLALFCYPCAAQVSSNVAGDKSPKNLIAPLSGSEIERSAKNLPAISEPRTLLLKATGWALQDNGDWISAQNRIPFQEAEFNRSGKALYKLGRENFTSLEMRDVLIGTELYTIFIIHFNTGKYEFPMLLDGWHAQRALSYYVFKSSRLRELMPDNITLNLPVIVNTEVLCEGTLVDFDKNTVVSTIANTIQTTLANKPIASHDLLLAVLPFESAGQKMVRFKIIQVMNQKKFYGPYLSNENRNSLFRRSYYETTFNELHALIRY